MPNKSELSASNQAQLIHTMINYLSIQSIKGLGRRFATIAGIGITVHLASCGGESGTSSGTTTKSSPIALSGELETFVSESVTTIRSPPVTTDVTYKKYSAADYPTATVNTTGLAVTDTTVTVGQLHSIKWF